MGTANPSYRGVAGVLFDKDTRALIQYPSAKAGDTYTIPNGVLHIGSSAFGAFGHETSPNLTGVSIPQSVRTIGYHAFAYCTSLTNVSVGTGVADIGGSAFYGCTSLTNVTVGTAVGVHFTYTTNNRTITITGHIGTRGGVTIPDTINGLPVTVIANGAFRGSDRLTSVTIGTNVTTIGAFAFADCRSLTNVALGDKVTNLGPGVLSRCERLAGLTIGTNVTSIAREAFFACTSLTNVNIPNSVTNIGNSVFRSCLKLTSATIDANVTNRNSFSFAGCPNMTNVTIGKNVTNIGARAFMECNTLTSITVDPLNPVYSSLAGVLFNKNQTLLIEYPGGKAGNYTIPSGVLHLGNSAFESCLNLTGVAIPDSVTDIGNSAFSDCVGLTNVTAGASVTNIGVSAFESCVNLTSIKIPESVTSIGSSAFAWCLTLANLAIPTSITNIGRSAFYYCPKLTSLMVPNGVTRIGSETFAVSAKKASERREKTMFEKKQDSLVLRVVKWDGSEGELRAAREAWMQAKAARRAQLKARAATDPNAQTALMLSFADDDEAFARVLHYDLWVVSNGVPMGVVWQNTLQDSIGANPVRLRIQNPDEPAAPEEPVRKDEDPAVNHYCGVRDTDYNPVSQTAVVAYTDHLGRLMVDYVRRGGNNGRPVKPQHTGTVADVLVKGTNAFADIRILPGPSDASLKVCVSRASGAIESLVWTGDGWKNEITPPKKEAPEKKP
ncbi:MAG: leucine-rich repeat domain-containing protein [Verrucomicrobia bacterium]|nr:leucine-rich repeat domain-containing protein [Verrucomicrobiota bacterium]